MYKLFKYLGFKKFLVIFVSNFRFCFKFPQVAGLSSIPGFCGNSDIRIQTNLKTFVMLVATTLFALNKLKLIKAF